MNTYAYICLNVYCIYLFKYVYTYVYVFYIYIWYPPKKSTSQLVHMSPVADIYIYTYVLMYVYIFL